MSEYGLRIRNIEAASLYYCNLGLRQNYQWKKAMLSNSLFKDFLVENGLDVWKGESTRDLICLEFGYGTRSYEEEIEHLNRQIDKVNQNPDISEEEKEYKIKKYNDLKAFADENKSKYIKLSKESVRIKCYEEGVDVTYPVYDKKRNLLDTVTIHYKMFYRTPGKAKKGSCMFIREELYDKAHKFLTMGIELPYENAPIVEMGAYSSLITSSIVEKIQINPENILVLRDYESFFTTKVVSVETNENRQCRAVKKDNYTLKNVLFDGQALIDTSIFPEWGEGYILLRHHMCKMAAFHSNIQLFFKDYYKDDYETATVKDMFGNAHRVKDILLITTDNSMKWLKFGISYDYWCENVRKNHSMFGIVKTAHKSKLGEVQQMSYQMINSLDIGIMDKVLTKSIKYIEKLKSDDNEFLSYLKKNQNFANDFEVLVALCEQDPEFVRCDYFRERKKAIIYSYVTRLKAGKVIQEADNLVIVGSPYAMLLHTVGVDPESDDTFVQEVGAIQCSTKRFKDGEYLACFRNPFNGRGNLGVLHNVYNGKLDKYFNFGELIIAVNLVHTDFQSRNNGADQDSDSIYCTNQSQIVSFASHCYKAYPTIENNIPKEKNSYANTLHNYAVIDNNLAAAQLAIGESSNLAQLCLTYSYNFEDTEYDDYVAILSVIAQCAIDNAKRKYDIDLAAEIQRIKRLIKVKENGYPIFWTLIRRDFNEARINEDLKCPMNYMYKVDVGKFRSNQSTLPISQFFVKYELDGDRRKSKKVEDLIEKYSLKLFEWKLTEKEDYEEFLLTDGFDELIEDIKTTYISNSYIGLISWLINRAFRITGGVKSKTQDLNSKTNKNKPLLLKVLYKVNPKGLLKCFAGNVGSSDAGGTCTSI